MRPGELKIEYLEETDSTNSFISGKAESLELPFCVAASFQRKGRGQENNQWVSKKGKNLLFSLAIQPRVLPPSRSFYISRVASLALTDFYQQELKGIMIKWPNDILCESKKIAGILIENTFYGSLIKRSIIGAGVNLNQDDFPSFHPEATSFKIETGRSYDINRALEYILGRFFYWAEFMDKGKLNLISREYNKRLYGLGKYLNFISGDEKFSAKIIGVEDDGHLLIQKPSGQKKKFAFKEVSFAAAL